MRARKAGARETLPLAAAIANLASNSTFATDQASGSISRSGRRTGVALDHALRDFRRTTPVPKPTPVTPETYSVLCFPIAES